MDANDAPIDVIDVTRDMVTALGRMELWISRSKARSLNR